MQKLNRRSVRKCFYKVSTNREMCFSARGVVCLVEGKKLFGQFTVSVDEKLSSLAHYSTLHCIILYSTSLSSLHQSALYNTVLLHCIALCNYSNTVHPMHTKLRYLRMHSAVIYRYVDTSDEGYNTEFLHFTLQCNQCIQNYAAWWDSRVQLWVTYR